MTCGMTMLFKINLSLCHDAFWDLNVTWNTEVPDFTECFQQTVLVLAVCIFFAILTLISLCQIPRNGNPTPLPWTRLNITKVVICITLIGLSTSKLGINIKSALINDHVVDSAIFSSGARSITFILVLVLMFQHRAYGIRTSTLLCLFWFCFSVCDAIIYRSSILRFLKMVSPVNPEDLFVLDMIIFPLIFAELFLSLFADAKSYTRLEKFSPFDDEPFFSYLTFSWMNSTIKKGLRKQLNIDDIPPLSFQQKANYLWKKFEAKWSVKPNTMADCSGVGGQPSLAWTLVKAYWPWMLNTFLLNVICNFVTLVPPLILNLLIDFFASDEYAWKGYFYCVLLIFADLAQKLTLNHFQFFAVATGAQVKSALTGAAYRKSLKMSSATKGEFPSGAITNLVAVDVQRIVMFSMYFGNLISAPMKIVLTMMMLWRYLGAASIAGIAIIALLMPLTLVSSNSIAKLFEKQMKMKDARLKDMNEILSGIKILKFYAWEIPFMSKIGATRNKELRFTLICQFFYVAIDMIFTSAPVMVAIASFTTYILMDKTHVLSPSTAFVSLNLINILKYSLFEVPDTISELIQTNISLGRLRKFFIAEEYNASVVGDSPKEGLAVSVTGATLSWVRDADPATLQDVNLGVAEGSLVAIIGPVGSGKSSVLSALLAEMYKKSGSINIKGSLAYVPQQAWILNKTVKQNILLMQPMDEKFYNEILDCCCLRPDFEILPGGDETEIGERGINLSGGQKQRISVARAVFQNADIYLLDDPLSAVDAHVRKDLFDNVIGNMGLLRRKTRILVTHDISVLSRCDQIVSMKDGKIEEIGTYSELMSNCGSFMNFVQEHSSQDVTEEHANEKKSQNLVDDVELLDCTVPFVDGGGDVGTSNKQIQYAEPIKLTEEEKMEIGKVSRGIYLKYVKNAGVLWILLAISGIVVFEAFEIGSNVWLSEWSNDASAPNATSNDSLRKERLTVYGVLGVAQVLLSAVGSSFLIVASIQAARTYHSKMLHSVIRSPMHFFDTTPFGRIINRFSSDMDIVDVNIVYDIDGWLKCMAQILGIFIVIGMNLPMFLPALIPIIIVYYLIQKLYLNTSRQLKRLESVTKSPIYSHFLESIQGTSSIKAYRIESQFTDKLEAFLDTHVLCYFQSYSSNRWLAFLLGLLGDVVIIITCCLAIHSKDVLSASSVGLTVTYAVTVTTALLWLVRCNTQLENKSISVERLQEYCSLTPEAEWRVAESDPGPMWPQKGVIQLEDYSTRYREGLDLVLNSINLEVLSNEKVGIVGRTGAGKSSMTLALFRIVEPAGGRIIIDNVDVSTIGLHALRSKLTIIPQDPILFTGSLRLNLDPNNEYSDDQIWQSLKQAHMKEFVSNLSDGLEYELTEGGGNLSVGQRQLACLARALLKQARVLVLDEATAAVDMDTDKLIQNTIRTEFLDSTVITIAHRLNTVLDYDKIVVMDSGRICEVGNPMVLLQDSQSKFHSMAKDAKLI